MLAATAAALGVAGWMGWSHEARIDAAVERATAQLDASRPISAESKRAAELLDELDARIAECAGSDDTIAPPWTWHPAFDAGLRSRLAPLGPFLDAAAEVHGSDAVAHVLEHGHRLDRRTSLLWSRERTNVLCAQAIVDARDGRSEAAAERIAQALELARADFEPTGWELGMNSISSRIVFDGLRCMLLEGRVDPAILDARLASVFESAARSPSLDECLRGDALATLAADWERSEWRPGPVERWNLRGAAAERLESIGDGTFAASVAAPKVSVEVYDLEPMLTAFTARTASAAARRLDLARTVVRIAALRARHGAWPASIDAGSDPSAGYGWIVDRDEARLMARIEDEPERFEVWSLR